MKFFHASIIFYVLKIAIAFRVESDSCSKRCEELYQQPHDLSACTRGCRLFSINQLTPIRLGENEALHRCEQDCDTCYEQRKPLVSACHYGCQKQEMLPTPAALQQIEEEKIAFAIRIGPFTPQAGAMIHQYCYKMLNNAVTFIGISSFLSEDRDQGVLVKIEEQQPVGFQSSSEETLIVASFDGESGRWWSLHPITIYHVSNTWIGCVAVRTGLPKWLIASVLIIALVTVFYLCCNPLFDDEDENKVVTFSKELSISANDIERVPLFTVKNSQEAGPLPDKLLIA